MQAHDEPISRLCSIIFDPVSRSDQHKWARLYVRGLLAVRGRKTMRGMASLFGKRAVEQNLHHFISKSSWEWRSVRRLLAQHLDRVLAPEAWVVDEMVTPKRGPHSVGVERTFVPKLGRIVDNQRAFGVWLAAEDRSCPVNWRLLLPTEWAACPSRRRRAGIPESLAAEPPELCALNAALEMIEEWDIDRRPLIMDARNGDAPRLLAELVDRDVPFLIRIDDSVDLAAADPGGPPRPSHHLDDLLRRRCKPVEWRDVHGSARRRSPAATMPVSVTVAPATGRAPRGRTVELALLAEWSGRGQSPAARWLTNVAAPMAALVRLTKLAHQVANDFAEVSTTVGIQDFEGRSFAGWHRHVTLVSAAHAVLMTAQAAGGALIPRPRAHDDRVLAGSGAGGRP